MEKGLKKDAISGIKWTTITSLFNSIIAPFYQIFLALLLSPKEFAYIAVISILIGFSALICEIGLGEALIQKEKVSNQELSTLIYFNSIITLLFTSIVYLLAPYIQNYYKFLPELLLIIKLLCITLICNGISAIFRINLQKYFLFKEYSLLQISKISIEILISILLIIKGIGIFGYVMGVLISTIIYSLLIIIISINKTGINLLFHFNIKDIVPFFTFGFSISLKRILTFLSQRIDEIIVAGVLTANEMGIYYFGKRLILQVQTVISNSYSQVLYPFFSRLKNDLKTFKKSYLEISYYTAMLAFPILIGIALTIDLIIPIIFGSEWIGATKIIKILSIAMLFQILTANVATSTLYSLNKPKLVLYIDIFTITTYLICLFLFSEQGLIMVLYIYTAYIISKAIILQVYVSKFLNYKFYEYIFRLKNIVISIFIMCLLVLSVQYYFSINIYLKLLVSVLAGVISYSSSQILLDKSHILNLLKFLKTN
ncbi:oligosaccharide flippase family protein [Ureibacillus chungkukjangi]|uniref:oligosaccharide flippase family protein n=1 Tax=Ureibacillus chungkukjangi TaxID=1202712 RepID=UPI00384AFE36